MRVEKVSAKEVTGKLAELAKAKQAASGRKIHVTSGKQSGQAEGGHKEFDEFEDIVKKKDAEAFRRKAERERKREERKLREQEENEEEESCIDPNMAAMMGFGSFGGGAKKR